ncbi:MAG: hypothetical protein ACRECO_14770 [Xanthobacteraceae bacterium]
MLRLAEAALAAVNCAPAYARQDIAQPIADCDRRAASRTDPVHRETIPGMTLVAIDDVPCTDDFRMGNEPGLRSGNEKTNSCSMRLPPSEKRPVDDCAASMPLAAIDPLIRSQV